MDISLGIDMNDHKDLRIRIVRNMDEFLKLETEWNRVLSCSDFDTVFLTHEWFSSFIRAFNLEQELLIILIYDRPELIGILPLHKKRVKHKFIKGMILKSISNDHTPKYSFIFKTGAEDSLPRALTLLQEKLPWVMIHTDFVSQDSFMVKRPLLVKQDGIQTQTVPVMESAYILLSGDWNNYYYKIFSKSLRKKIERLMRRVQSSYEVSFETIEGEGFKRDDLEKAFRIEDSGWKGKMKTSIISDDNVKRFYELLAFAANRQKWFELRFLRFGPDRVAFEYNLKYKHTLYSLKAGYDERFKKFSPGHMLTKDTIKHAFEEKNNIFDMLGPTDEYKRKMTNRTETLYRIYYFNRRMISRIMRFTLFDTKEIADRLGIKAPIKEVYYRLKGSRGNH